MVILNHETYKEVGSYHLTLLNVYTLLSMLMVIGALIVTVLLFFTPLKRLIPGYASQSSGDYISLYKKVEKMEAEMGAQQIILASCKN